MKQAVRFGLLGLLGLVGYLVMIPGTWIDALLQRASLGSLSLTATSGTIWHGDGYLQALLPDGEVLTLAPVAWTVSPGELLQLRLHFVLRSTPAGHTLLDASLGPGEIQLHQANLALPAALLGCISPTVRAAALAGQLTLQAQDLSLGDGHAAGEATVLWSGAGSDLAPVHPLGNYRLQVRGQGEELALQLSTLNGVLHLTGLGHLPIGERPEVRVTAVPAADQRQNLAALLRVLGREISPGTFLLSI